MADRSACDVLTAALAYGPDDWERWDLVSALHKRGDEETFHAARRLLDDARPDRRVLAVNVLAQLGVAFDVPVEERPFRGQTGQLLLERMPVEHSSEVLAAMASAWGHLCDPRGIPLLHAMREHPDDNVRFGVVFGLLGLDEDLAIATLVELSEDGDADVRDWATFGLGTQIDRDNDTVREALVARLADADDDTREEALVGLARCGDVRAIPRLLVELDDSDDPGRIEEALLLLAAKTGAAALCAHVERSRLAWKATRPDERMPDDLRAAVERYAHS